MNSHAMRYSLLALQIFLLVSCTGIAPSSVNSTETPIVSDASKAVSTVPKMEVGSRHLYADGAVLVAVPAGTFMMGVEKGADNPEHEVNLSDYWIYSTKVTNNQYALCISSGNCTPLLQAHNPNYNDPIRGNDPVVGVNYEQALAYCSFANARLPTEAEWEKAARGPNGNIYPWGDDEPSCELLNYGNCVGETTSVVEHPDGRSYYQAYDMKGNALEWVADWYQEDYYLNSPYENPFGPSNGINRVVRSSAYNSGGDQTENYHRFQSRPDTQRDNLSFRCVVENSEITHFAPFCEYPATYGTDGIGGEVITDSPIEMKCPDISIQQAPFCQGTISVTNLKLLLTFDEQLYSLTYGAPNACRRLSTNSPISFECRNYGSGQPSASKNNFTFCSYCNVTTKSEPQCPTGYKFSQQTKTCVNEAPPAQPPKSGTWACLPGFTLSNSGSPLTTAVPITPVSSSATTTVSITPVSSSATTPVSITPVSSSATTPVSITPVSLPATTPVSITPVSSSAVTGGYCCAYTPPTYDENKVGDIRNPICRPNPNGIGMLCFPPFPSCPRGTFFDGQNCLTVTHPQFCIAEPVIYKACINDGQDLDPSIDPGGGGCTITEQSCADSCLPNYGWIYDLNACTCSCLTG